MAKEMSEFGAGFVLCLVKFAEHFGDTGFMQNEPPDLHAKMVAIYKTEKAYTASRVSLWANAASDHLYKIKAPRGWRWRVVRKHVAELQRVGLKMGHGFTNDLWTNEDIIKLWDVVKIIALETDRILGVPGDAGKW